MNSNLTKLIPAVVSAVNERQSYVTKTKLLKLLYLFDVEWYRTHQETYTGFDWMFHLLGPWTSEYDPTLEILVANENVKKRSGGDAFDTEFFTTDEQVFLNRIFEDAKDSLIFEKVMSTWGNKTTPEILDYVYFRTEPMRSAKRGEKLNFSSISERPPALYTRGRSGRSTEQIAALRRRISERLETEKKEPQDVTFTPPKYDDAFFEAMDKLESLK